MKQGGEDHTDGVNDEDKGINCIFITSTSPLRHFIPTTNSKHLHFWDHCYSCYCISVPPHNQGPSWMGFAQTIYDFTCFHWIAPDVPRCACFADRSATKTVLTALSKDLIVSWGHRCHRRCVSLLTNIWPRTDEIPFSAWGIRGTDFKRAQWCASSICPFII